MKTNILAGLGIFLISGVAFAGCPDSMNAKKMAECTEIENSGQNYQEWQKGLGESETVTDSDSMMSPVTGTDIRTVAPAAGTPENDTDKE